MRACGGCRGSTSLELGARGAFEGRPFRLVGSLHVVSRAGGHWHEHRAALDGGGEAWLAEAAGSFFWMREAALAPPWQRVALGERAATDFVAVERGEATRVARAGDLEDLGDEPYRYVDLSGPRGAFATIDYGEPARTFVGRRVTLAEVELRPRRGARSFLPVGGRGFSPAVAPGSTVTLGGASFTVLGALARSGRGKGEKKRWRWEECLLWREGEPARWLVASGGRWSVATAVDAGGLREDGRACVSGRTTFRRRGEGVARLDAAVGQFPFEVRVGHEAKTAEWAHGTATLSRETTDNEVAWSLVTPLDSNQAARALGASVRTHGKKRED